MSPFPREAFRPLSRYTPDRRPSEVDLSDNTNRWGAHPAALEIVRSAEEVDLNRYPSVYADALREAVAKRYGVPVDCVVTGCGSDDLLDQALRAICDPGEGVAYIPPTFSMVEIFAKINGLVEIPVREEGIPDPERLLDANPALVYVCRPNNPTGEVVPRSWVERLLEAAGPDGPVVLLDEAYAEFADDDFVEASAGSRRLLVLRTFSKAFGLAGLRVGYAIGPAEVVAEVEKSRGPYKVSRIAERAAVAALADDARWVPSIVAKVRSGRERLAEALHARGLQPVPSGANFILVPLPDGRRAVPTKNELRERGVAIRPFSNLPGFGDAIRISIGPREEMERFLEALDEVLA